MFARYSSAVVTGSATTFFLFFLMQSLIALQPGATGTERTRHTLGLAEVREEREVPPPEYKPVDERIKDFPRTPPRQASTQNTTAPVGVPDVTVPLPGRTGNSIGFRLNDGPLVPIVRVQPVYPAQPLTRNREGWVLVEFDVRPDGSVANAFVVESSHRSFEKSALSAIYKFRYKPAVVDGIPQTSTGLQNLFRFEIARD